MPKLPATPESVWIPTPINPTVMAMSAVFLYPIFCNILPAGYPITAYAMKLANTPRVPIQLGTPN